MALGPERTRNELLPYILGKDFYSYKFKWNNLIMTIIDLMDDEEEVLIGLAEVLGSFLDYTGGPAYSIHLIKPLEKLCQVEESTVRDKVIRNIV